MKIFFRSPWRGRNGSVLILAFWALGLLSVFAVMMGHVARSKLSLASRLYQAAQLRYAAQAGIARIKAKLSAPDAGDINGGLGRAILYINDGESENMPFGKGYVVSHVFDEESRVNINTVPRDVLKRLVLSSAGITEGDATAVAEAIVDWRDPDSSPEPNGAEDSYYNLLAAPYDAKDAPFNSTDELLLVRGITGKIYDGLAPYVTVCGAGAVNINSAAAPALIAVGLDNPLVDKILQYRAGKDGEPGTVDDRTGTGYMTDFLFQEPEEITLTEAEKAALTQKAEEGLLGTTSSYLNVESRASGFGSSPHDFTVHAVYKITPTEQKEWDMTLEFWRTSL